MRPAGEWSRRHAESIQPVLNPPPSCLLHVPLGEVQSHLALTCIQLEQDQETGEGVCPGDRSLHAGALESHRDVTHCTLRSIREGCDRTGSCAE
jgi:hypothetical protein